MNDIVTAVETRFRPYFDQLAMELAHKYPSVKFSVYNESVGSATSFQGYQVGIEALFPTASSLESDNLAFSISMCHLTTEPKVMVDIAWGAPTSDLEACLWDCASNNEWPLVTPERLDEIEAKSAELSVAFEQAVARGRPRDADNPE